MIGRECPSNLQLMAWLPDTAGQNITGGVRLGALANDRLMMGVL